MSSRRHIAARNDVPAIFHHDCPDLEGEGPSPMRRIASEAPSCSARRSCAFKGRSRKAEGGSLPCQGIAPSPIQWPPGTHPTSTPKAWAAPLGTRRPRQYYFGMGTPGKKRPAPSSGGRPARCRLATCEVSGRARSLCGALPAITTQSSTSIAGLTRNQCPRSARVCDARNAATSAPVSGRTGRSCARCQDSRGDDAA
jgi:hypothetical protein